jgi:hypothetical protein
MSLSRAQIQEKGYQGFVSFGALRKSELHSIPQLPGTYVVIAPADSPVFLETSRGGHFKGKDPVVTLDAIQAKWVEGAEVVYIGKAENLQRRVKEFCRFGAGDPIGHWGGRYLWQVEGSDDWLVGWKRCMEGETALGCEAALLEEFTQAHGGRLPFANLRR